jgi:uncharacterized protein YbbC (DUF1343 family)
VVTRFGKESQMLTTGLERILRHPQVLAQSGNLGLLYNQASVDSNLRPAPDLLNNAFPGRLKVLFGPQHGVAGIEQANMIETGHAIHPLLGISVFSLYSEIRKPTASMLKDIDTVTAVLILDRPNPIDGRNIEGNLLNEEFSSFVGPHPIPMRHGLTLGELMHLYNEEHGIKCRLRVIPMAGWDRDMYFENTGLPWVLPSPNMPLVETALVYPGQVMLEGTNLSEGRGTTRPFEIFGAPYIEPKALFEAIEAETLKGVILRETGFIPTFDKWAGQLCKGFQIHVQDRRIYRPYKCSLAIIAATLKLYPQQFNWIEPPYEYVSDKLPIDVIIGDSKIRMDLEQGRSVSDMGKEWQQELNKWIKIRSRFLLYPV